MRKRKRIRKYSIGLFIIYMMALIYFLLLSDGFSRVNGYSQYRYNLVPFQEIKRFILYWRAIDDPIMVLVNLLGNVVAFIPFGALIRWVINRRVYWYQVTGYTFLFSLCVELLQLITRVGVFDVDDLILNTLGGLIGFWIYYGLLLLNRRREQRDKGKCI